MKTTLALKKYMYKIHLSSGGDHIVMLDTPPEKAEWRLKIQNKMVVDLDNTTINFAYVTSVKTMDRSDDTADTAMTWAKMQAGAMRTVACERVRGYESKGSIMPIKTIISRTQAFMQNGRNGQFGKRLDLYVSSGGSLDDIGPFIS